ncbi:TPA: hypothetical protein NJ582_003370 [Vibrio parahaemolyticus]|nr:hypothetical protein [Vibrio parahaemolyticus]
MNRTKVIFVSNVTLGYSSPKYLAFLKLLQKEHSDINIETYERWDFSRKYYNIQGVNISRNVMSNWISKIGFKKNTIFVKLIRRFSLLFSELNLVLKVNKLSKRNRIILVTTFDSPFWGWLVKENITIVQNYSEVWQDDHKNPLSFLTEKLFSKLISKYRSRVDICISPQEDRLKIAEGIYPYAEHFLVLNCPLKLENTPSITKGDNIKILYQGVVGKHNYPIQLLNMLIHFSEKYEVHFAGRVDNSYIELLEEAKSRDNFFYHGYLNQDQLSELREKCNVGIVFWDESNLNTKYCAPNKLFEYIANGYYVISCENHSLNNFNALYKYGEHLPVNKYNYFLNSLNPQEFFDVRKKNLDLHFKELNFDVQNEKLMDRLKKHIYDLEE